MLTEKALVLSATMAVLAAPVAHPDSALAMSWQERLAEMQQRKEQVLSEACASALATSCHHQPCHSVLSLAHQR